MSSEPSYIDMQDEFLRIGGVIMLFFYSENPLSPIQILLLVFVQSGMTSPYDLIKNAGMSGGLTGPTLRRMEADGLLTMTKEGTRQSTRYSLTEKGTMGLQKALERGEKDSWGLYKNCNFESVPRAVLLAWIYSGAEAAHQCIDWAIKELSEQYADKQNETDRIYRNMVRMRGDLIKDDLFTEEYKREKGILMTTAYKWMKAKTDAALLKMQIDVLQDSVGSLIAELPDSLHMPLDNK